MTATMVRCPKCGAPNPDDPRRVRRCSACHEALVTCRHCQGYDPRIFECTSLYRDPETLRVTDPDELRNCRHLSSLLSAGPRARPRLLRTVLVTAVLAAAVGLGALRFARPGGGLSSVLPLKASVSITESAVKDDGFDIQVLLFNPTKQAVKGVQVMVTSPKLKRLTCQYTDPSECLQRQRGRTVTAAAGDLPPGEHYGLLLHFTAEAPGVYPLTAHLTAANAAGVDVYEMETEVMP